MADWWHPVPATAKATYVGGQTCAQCHSNHHQQWSGSHHDLAMDLATDSTVLGNFNQTSLEHFGITSTMFKDGEKFMVRTEGPDGKLADFQVKYVFGVEPLQQYMVEFDRPANLPKNEIARLQVLRITWDTVHKRWYYLSPPDVDDKLAPTDPLHWTQSGQNWNHMCADCHSTNLKKGFDVATKQYHTTFSDIDVNCESCHGPGSIHVQLANAKSLFWDRNWGYGLKQLKGQDAKEQVENCAPCHSRRRVIHSASGLHDTYFDCFLNEPLRPETYYADGQIKDEVYVFGSYTQSKMYHKGILCTDCHDPHTTKLKFNGNNVCTSCHQHPVAKYDSPGHHFHQPGSAGAQCVNCHMPSTPYMEVDFRRDHSLRVPRPDLSVQLGTPNACTGCHVDAERIPEQHRAQLTHYSKWLAAADKLPEVAAELERTNRWAAELVEKWYGTKERPPHFASALAPAWEGDLSDSTALQELVKVRSVPAIVRATALEQLRNAPTDTANLQLAIRQLDDPDPQVRVTALAYCDALPVANLLQYVWPLLQDEDRIVRTEAARILAIVPPTGLTDEERQQFDSAIQEYREGLFEHADQAGSHMALALLSERLAAALANGNANGAEARQVEHLRQAMQSYQNAIAVQPDVTGPRSNLAALLEQFGDPDEAARLRAEELPLMARDASMAPNMAPIQYRYGLLLYLNQQNAAAAEALQKACTLEPTNVDFRLLLTLLLEKMQRWDEAQDSVQRLLELEPTSSEFQQIQLRIQQSMPQQ